MEGESSELATSKAQEMATQENAGGNAYPCSTEISRAMTAASQFAGRLAEAARADAVVGQAQIVEGQILVPLASVRVVSAWGLGFGGGSGTSPGGDGNGMGGGAGGGGQGSSRVIAIAQLSENGVKVK